MKSPKLLSRTEFRESVFERDNHKCVICKNEGQDAHHIIERRLFDDGGYYVENGATLCGECHINAEKTLITCEEIRRAASIERVILPEHLYPDNQYDKWGNIINQNGTRLKGELFFDESVQKILQDVIHVFTDYVKYPRTYHLPISSGRTKDDKAFEDFRHFEGQQVVATVKLDGENTSGYADGYVHARSIDSRHHESRSWVKNFLQRVVYELPQGWRIAGENLYAKHSIKYDNLKSYFYLFSIWNDRNVCLSWDETVEWAGLLGVQLVPVLYKGIFDEKIIRNLYTPEYQGNECEGFVLRNARSFAYGEFRYNVGKWVRPEHVQTNQHWLRTALEKNELE